MNGSRVSFLLSLCVAVHSTVIAPAFGAPVETCAGALDTGFHPAFGNFNFLPNRALVRPDGKVWLGWNYTLLRMNQRDEIEFNLPTEAFIKDMALQADGRLLFLESFGVNSHTDRRAITRLNVDDTVDNTFNPPNGGENLALQADGKIVVGYWFLTDTNSQSLQSIARLNGDGSVDSSFNPAGNTVQIGGVIHVAVQADGRLLVSGYMVDETINANEFPPGITLVRLHPDGSRDLSFQSGPTATNGPGPLRVLPDGRILVGGSFGIRRLLPDGTLDPSFHPASIPYQGYSFLVQPDGKIITTTFTPTVIRLHPDGLLDTSYHSPVFGYDPLDDGTDVLTVLALLPNGNALVSGNFFSADGLERDGFARLLADGPCVSIFVVPPGPVEGSYFVSDTAGFVRIPVRRLGPGGGASVGYATVPLSAKPGRDYLPRSGVLHFGADEREKFVEISIRRGGSGDRVLRLELRKASKGAILGEPSGTYISIYSE
jgi:uncharacterized delta-60 repeat protein